MSDVRARPAGPAAAGPRIDWHPEPELINLRDEAASRAALREAGAAVWETALDYLYGHAFARAMGEPVDYDALRTAFFGPSGRPAPAPTDPATLEAVLDEFATRVAPHTVSAYHPRSFGYFTPPPLLASVAGEVLAQVAQQGIDVWHAGPIGAFVEEEVLRWLCDLVGYGEGSFGILTSGGVMANFIAMAIVRDVHLSRVRGAPPARGRALEGVRVYASDQTHFSIGRALDELGFPPETLAVVPGGRRLPPPGGAGRGGDPARPGGGAPADRDRRGRGLDEHRRRRRDRRARRPRGPRGPLAPRRRGVRRGGAALRPGRGSRCRTWSGRSPSRSTPTNGSSRRMTSAGSWSASGPSSGEAFGGRRPEYYRAGLEPGRARTAADERNGHDGAPMADDDGHGSADQLNFWRLGFEGTRRWRALKLWLSWKHVGSDGLRRGSSRRTTTWPRTSRRGSPRPTTSRRCPRSRRCPSCASGTCRAVGRRPRRDRRRRPTSTRTRIGCRPRSRRAARAGSRQPGCAGRRTSGQGSSTRNRPSMTSMTCSSCSGASPAMPDPIAPPATRSTSPAWLAARGDRWCSRRCPRRRARERRSRSE